mmetsp:Transcript_21029/g.53828  ORF Transcript_21029/g.53828 Transcript_21029/m.53828 type:complete len:231 (-) Transcript_21029:829-1521(-)
MLAGFAVGDTGPPLTPRLVGERPSPLSSSPERPRTSSRRSAALTPSLAPELWARARSRTACFSARRAASPITSSRCACNGDHEVVAAAEHTARSARPAVRARQEHARRAGVRSEREAGGRSVHLFLALHLLQREVAEPSLVVQLGHKHVCIVPAAAHSTQRIHELLHVAQLEQRALVQLEQGERRAEHRLVLGLKPIVEEAIPQPQERLRRQPEDKERDEPLGGDDRQHR